MLKPASLKAPWSLWKLMILLLCLQLQYLFSWELNNLKRQRIDSLVSICSLIARRCPFLTVVDGECNRSRSELSCPSYSDHADEYMHRPLQNMSACFLCIVWQMEMAKMYKDTLPSDGNSIRGHERWVKCIK